VNISAVVADTSVLFSRVLRDYLMYAGIAGIIQLHWSESILDELERNLSQQHKMSAMQGNRLRTLINLLASPSL